MKMRTFKPFWIFLAVVSRGNDPRLRCKYTAYLLKKYFPLYLQAELCVACKDGNPSPSWLPNKLPPSALGISYVEEKAPGGFW